MVTHVPSRLWSIVLAMMVGLVTSLAQVPATYHARADAALQSFLLKFWNGGSQYLRNRYPSDGSLTSYWVYANAWEAVMDGVERTSGLRYSGMIETFYLGQNERSWYSDYYDDECWMTVALLRAYDLAGDPKYLSQAQVLFADIMAGWDTNCCGSPKGGVWWDKAHTQKATAANAGAALAGAGLYRRTGNGLYLTFAQQVYAFWYANMVNPATGQVCDHINPDGTKVWWRFTYNEGLMIGASIELGEATGNAGYFVNAHKIAGYMVANEVTPTAYGPALYDGSNTGCGGDCHQFKGPAYRYLARLYAHDTTRGQYYNVLRGSADAIWNLARETNSTIFSVNWAGPAQTNIDQSQHNAACTALSRFAQHLGGYGGTGSPAKQYEAEDSVLHRLGVEATYGAYTGWGYVAGWNSHGQSVDFKVYCATPGSHNLAFRYAGGAGVAYRAILVNGANLISKQAFGSTGNWSTYATLTVPCSLPAGWSTISVVFDSAKASSNWLNLDHLTVNGDASEQISINSISIISPGTARIGWDARPRNVYQLQYLVGGAAGLWTNAGGAIIATNTSAMATDAFGSNRSRLYRVVQPTP
jgi:predicted alpha-1,6-mannanase (GH76 family)